jgi:hypothetical protein
MLFVGCGVQGVVEWKGRALPRNILTVPVRRVDSTTLAPPRLGEQDLLAVDEPLQICVGDSDLAITMRTPGNWTGGRLSIHGMVRAAGRRHR